MFSIYERLLIKKFLFSKKSDGYISIFSWFSIIGIMIGVAAIIIVMSVMNGFREELTSRILGVNGHINIMSSKIEIDKSDVKLFNKNILSLNINNLENINIYPIIETQALLITNNISKGVVLRSYENVNIDNEHFLSEKIIEGNIYKENSYEVIIGYALARRLGIKVGNRIKIAVPKTDNTIFGNIPRFKTLTISGIFNLGMYEFDSNFIFTNPIVPRKLLMLDRNTYNQIDLYYSDPNNIEKLTDSIKMIINEIDKNFYASSWKENNSSLINALKVEKNVMFLILTLIIIVASMNIISGLIIFVKEKNKDIGILKTIGLSDFSLIKIFLTIGLIIGLLGTIFGGLLGIVFSINISSIQKFLENLFNTELFSKEVYYLTTLPSSINNVEVFYVLLISILISLLATIFPAYRSTKIDPIISLKND